MSRGEGCVWSRGSHETRGAASAPGIQRPTTGQLSSSPLKPPQTHGQEGPRGQDNTKAQIRKSKPGGEASSGRRVPKCRPLVEGFAVHCAQGAPARVLRASPFGVRTESYLLGFLSPLGRPGPGTLSSSFSLDALPGTQ